MPNSLTFFPVSGDYRNVADPTTSGMTNVPDVEIIEGFVTFYPRLPKGFVAYVDDFQLASNVSEVVTLLITASGGTFTMKFGANTTSALAYNISASALQTALTGLASIGSGNAAVAAITGGFTITFQGALANQYLTGFLLNTSSLTGVATAETTTPGSSLLSRDTAIAIPPRRGRIWDGALSTIDVNDTPGVELVANSVSLALQSQGYTSLIYDVAYSSVTFSGNTQLLSNFGFTAPVDNTAICITDPTLHRLGYQGP